MPGYAHADGPVVFVSGFAAGDRGAIHAFRFDSERGVLKLLHRTTDIQSPFYLALSADGRFLYATDSPAKRLLRRRKEFVAAYAVDGHSGKLRRLNRQPARGATPCYLDVDATGKTVVLANYSSGSVVALPVGNDGSLDKANSFVQHYGSSVNASRQQEPHAHSIVVSPDNRFALAADLGTDQILIYRLTASSAELTPHDSQHAVSMPPGSGPRHLAFHPNGKQLYVINELANSVSYFQYASDSGTLTLQQTISTVPADFEGDSKCADLGITPDGQFLYGTNRGHDSIAIYRIADDGYLSLIGIESSRGKGPQNLLITPDGKWLISANMPGNHVIVFKIDSSTGGLTATGEPIEMPAPSCICLLP